MADGYYGRPVVKPPVWTWEIPLYFFVGGLAGMSAVIGLGALIAGRPALVAAAAWVAVGGAAVSAGLLISDLGRPQRFWAMLRVLKWRSPMSVGVWVLSAFGGAAALAVLGSLLDARWLTWLGLLAAAPLGAVVGTYTGVLIGATVIPAWATHRTLLPVHFGVAGLGSAAALLELMSFGHPALHALGLCAAVAETALGILLEVQRRGAADHAVHHGRAGWMLRSASILSGPLALGVRLAGAHLAAAVLFLVGALLSRFGWLAAGHASAQSPDAAFAVHGPR